MRSSKNKAFEFWFGVLLCFLGATLFSSKAIMVKLAYRDTSIDAVSLLALRMLFSFPFFVVSALFVSRKSGNVKFSLRQWIGVALIGCLGYYISSLLDFVGLQYVSAGIERLILFLYPTFVLLIMVFVFHQPVPRLKWIAVAVAYAGLLVAYFGEIHMGATYSNEFLFGSAMIFACSITFAGYIAGSGRMMVSIGSTKFNSYAMAFASAAVLIHFFITSENSLFGFEPAVYWHALIMALFATVVPSYLIAAGIKQVGSETAAIVGAVGPVSTIVQAYFFLDEPITTLQLTGTLLVLIGVLIVGRKPRTI